MTQLEAAREGIITKEMETAAREEGVSAEFIRSGIAEGTIVLPANLPYLAPSVCDRQGASDEDECESGDLF